jgi:hypothetical protein
MPPLGCPRFCRAALSPARTDVGNGYTVRDAERGGTQLWTVHGGTHIPTLDQPGWGDIVWAWLSSHSKP